MSCEYPGEDDPCYLGQNPCADVIDDGACTGYLLYCTAAGISVGLCTCGCSRTGLDFDASRLSCNMFVSWLEFRLNMLVRRNKLPQARAPGL